MPTYGDRAFGTIGGPIGGRAVQGQDDSVEQALKLHKAAKSVPKEVWDDTTGGTFMDRLAGAFKMTQEGQKNFLAWRYGPENVTEQQELKGYGKAPEKALYFRNPDNPKKWIRFNPAGADIGDMADFFVNTVEGLPAAAAYTAALTGGASAPVSAAIGGGAAILSNLAKQAVGASLPGEENATVGQRALSAGLSGGVEAVTGPLASGLGRAYKAPGNIIRGSLAKPTEKGLARGLELEAETGIKFRPAQVSERKWPQMIEGALKRHPLTADMIEESNSAQLGRLRGHMEKIMDVASPSSKSPGKDIALNRIQTAIKDYETQLITERRMTAEAMFGDIVKKAGNEKVFTLDNTIAKVNELIGTYETVGGSGESEVIAKYLSAKLKAYEKAGGALTPTQMKNNLSDLSAKLKRGRYMPDIDASKSDAIASELFNAHMADLEAAGVKNPALKEAGNAIKSARETYRVLSEDLRKVDDMIFNKTLGSPGSDIISKVLDKSWNPSQIKEGAVALRQANPQALKAYQTAVLEEILNRAMKPTLSKLRSGEIGLDPAQIALMLDDKVSGQNIKALFFNNKNIWKMLDNERESAALLASGGFQGVSPTMPLKWTMDSITGLVRGLAGVVTSPLLTAKQFTADFSTLLTPLAMAKIITHPDGLSMLTKLQKVSPKNIGKVNAVLNGLMGIAARNAYVDGIVETEREAREAKANANVPNQ